MPPKTSSHHSISTTLKCAVQRHLECLQKVVHLAQRMLQLAKKKNYNEVALESENRSRLINIVDSIQGKIERSVKTIPPEVYSEEIKLTIKQWQDELNRLAQVIFEVDQEILECLNHGKDQIKQELSSTYKSKIVHEKYIFSSTKK